MVISIHFNFKVSTKWQFQTSIYCYPFPSLPEVYNKTRNTSVFSLWQNVVMMRAVIVCWFYCFLPGVTQETKL